MRHLADATGKIVILDFILGSTLIFFSFSVAGMPLATLAGMALALIGLTRKRKYQVPGMGLFIFLLLIGLAWVLFDSWFLADAPTGDVLRRAGRIFGVFIVAVCIANGRLNLKSIVLGMAFSSIVNVGAYYLGIAPDDYPGFLTGWINDKNVSGLYYATIAILLFAIVQKRAYQLMIFLIFTLILWQTGSRTSLAAFAFAILWLIFAWRLNLFFKVILAVIMVRAVNFIEANFAQVGAFSDRSDTDLLRADIDAASLAKINASPWNGLGLGQAMVHVRERDFFFHNSFWTLLVEGGWLYLLLIVGATVYAAFLMKQKHRQQRVLYGEAAVVLLVICAWRLGEVFLTMPWGLVMGLALSLCAVPKNASRFKKIEHEPESQLRAIKAEETAP
ncbi:O-antigen ligase family protein [uncultured Rothia sp.]|uniref:O-antigen ligase family protein n=1 Tax=uncultured Rothia sp. TaxID=316088 RepID=UPI00321689E9